MKLPDFDYHSPTSLDEAIALMATPNARVLAGVALFYDLDGESCMRNAHVGVIGATDRPRRLPGVEAALNGQTMSDAVIAKACAMACAEVDPPGDIHGSAAYRRSLVGTLLQRALVKASR